MSAHTLIDRLAPLQGQPLNAAIDQIETAAHGLGYSVNVMDPEFSPHNIDNEPMRLNVRTDADGVITSFSIG